MAKRRKRRSRKSRSNPRRRRRLHARRKHRSNPRRRHRRAAARRRYRVRHANPRRTRRRRSSARSRRFHANPRRRGRRRHRRNPSLPSWAKYGLAALLAVAGYAVVSAGSFALTQRLDPSLETVARNRYIAAGAVTLIGLGLALAGGMPVIGLALAAGGAVAGVGTKAALLLGDVLDKRPAAQMNGMGAVINAATGRQKMNGYSQRMAGMLPPFNLGIGAVYGQNMAGMGAINARGVPPLPPWVGGGPF